MQILKTLRGELVGWARHPAVLMWRGHDAALSLRKAPEHYGRFGWTEPDDLPYVWPCAKEKR